MDGDNFFDTELRIQFSFVVNTTKTFKYKLIDGAFGRQTEKIDSHNKKM